MAKKLNTQGILNNINDQIQVKTKASLKNFIIFFHL